MTDFSNIPKGLIKVDNPDHPFTFDGPDNLLSDSNGLLAIFTIRENEHTNATKLFSRLTNSLIAYPASTQMLLLLDKSIGVPNSIAQFGKFYFNEFIEIKDIRKSKALIRDKKPEYKLKEIKNVQKKIFNIQSQVQRDNIEYIKKKKEFKTKISNQDALLKNKAKYFDRITQKEITTRANIFEYKNQLSGQKPLSNKISDLQDLQPFYEFVINSEFMVDNGVPYFKHLSRKALNVDSIPKIKFDPFKPTRVASLFGWHLVNSNDFTELEGRISKYKR